VHILDAIRLALASTALAGLASCGGSAPEERVEVDPSSLRLLTTGAVVGFLNAEDAHVWRGLPYARPPVGALRWRAPLPPEPWEGTREALEFGEPCVQFAGPLGARSDAALGDPTGSEDCLSLNVYAPRFGPDSIPRGGDRLPVMVWIHGGGNTIGEGALYNGTRIANRHGILLVAVNYRLGVLGWFSHPALRASAVGPDDRSGNFGTLDLVRALEWVRDNAAAFGGDPERVTVFGESAGGANIVRLLISPRARGLFHRGITQSGATGSTTRAEAEHYADDTDPGDERSSREVLLSLLTRDGRAADREAARTLADSWDDAETQAYLRGKSAFDLLSVYEGTHLGGMYSFPAYFEDGEVLPGAPLEIMRNGGALRVPVMLGTNRDESKLFMLFTSPHVTRLFGVPLWLSDERRYELDTGYMSLSWKMSGADEPAAALVRHDPRVWVYRFDWDEEPHWLWSDYAKMLGAGHGLEIPFVFGGFDRGPLAPYMIDDDNRAAAEKLSAEMMSYWAEFAHSGDPGRGRDGSVPEWQAWSEPDPEFMVLDTAADGGPHMSGETVASFERFMKRVAADPRFANDHERCEIYAEFVHWRLTEDEYRALADGACADVPRDAEDG
jgi:para-nitrobenzyl esterase